MVPSPASRASSRAAAPRARGDGPLVLAGEPVVVGCSPRPRGWSLLGAEEGADQQLLPAPAGMVPAATCASTGRRAAPRARGDGPSAEAAARSAASCSPRPRGWSLTVLDLLLRGSLLTAPAGMVPTGWCGRSAVSTAPRARGDGPCCGKPMQRDGDCSPRPRGWSRLRGDGTEPFALLGSGSTSVTRPLSVIRLAFEFPGGRVQMARWERAVARVRCQRRPAKFMAACVRVLA